MKLGWAVSWIPSSVRWPLSFELRSRVGRILSRRPAIDSIQPLYLNVGSGPERFTDYLNIDFYELLGGGSSNAPFLGADLRHPIPLPDGCARGIFSEHTMEHLTYREAERLLMECFRLLAPGGHIRLILPDMGLFARRYAAGDVQWFDEWERLYFSESEDPDRRTRSLHTPMMAISFVTQEYGHVSAWDFATVSWVLSLAGFSGVRQSSFRESADPMLERDLDAPDRKLVSLYVEAVKT